MQGKGGKQHKKGRQLDLQKGRSRDWKGVTWRRGRRADYELQYGEDPGFLSLPCELQIGAQLMHVE